MEMKYLHVDFLACIIRTLRQTKLCSNHVQGGAYYAEGEVPLTSFVLTALLECNCPIVVSNYDNNGQWHNNNCYRNRYFLRFLVVLVYG